MSANKFVEHQINFLPCPSKKKLQCTGQIRMNKWLRCLQPSDQSNAFKIRADIFFPSSITWYHWPTFLFVTWWWGDHRGCAWESFVDKLGWARFHVGSGIFSSLSNTGIKSLEALNWMKLPKSQSRMGGRITHSSCMQVSVPFDSLELSRITSLQHQSSYIFWCDSFLYNRFRFLYIHVCTETKWNAPF